MNIHLSIPLTPSAEQLQRLLVLQHMFAQVCNALAPQVKASRCWNRVALHHMAYRALRDQFPALGSQMVCNAIYSVSRASRLLFQHPASPFNIAKWGDKPLPLLHFENNSPVYFDRHTLSIKQGQLSMYTLDGRMRFQLELKAEDELNFHNKKLREITLSRDQFDKFSLSFWFTDETQNSEVENEERGAISGFAGISSEQIEIPKYLVVREAA